MELKEVFEPVFSFVRTFQKKDKESASKQAAKDRLKLVLMQDRASVSPDFFDMMKKELIDVIKKYIEIDEESLEVELTRGMEVGLEGPALYANIPIKNVKPVAPQGESDEVSVIPEIPEIPEPSAIPEITEERVDAAAEHILNQIEEIAKKNKAELLQNRVSSKQAVPQMGFAKPEERIEPTINTVEKAVLPKEEISIPKPTTKVVVDSVVEPVTNLPQESTIASTIEENVTEEVQAQVETVVKRPRATARKRTTTKKTTTRKKKEG